MAENGLDNNGLESDGNSGFFIIGFVLLMLGFVVGIFYYSIDDTKRPAVKSNVVKGQTVSPQDKKVKPVRKRRITYDQAFKQAFK